jgi:hypothetical protein
VVAALAALTVVVPACVLIARASFLGNRLDALLWSYEAGEAAVAMVLFQASAGAWSNYAIQAAVFAGVLTARAAERTAAASPSRRVWLPVALAVLGVLASSFNDLFDVGLRIATERAAAKRIFVHLRQSPSTFFFSNRPGFNRVDGRLELVYDDWLYPVFESLGLAEPRSRWLRRALTSGPVRAIVTSSPRPRIDGIPQDLRAFGYRPNIRVGPFYVSTR